MEWKVKFDSYEKQNTMPMDRAKIEAARAIAEQLERQVKVLDEWLPKIFQQLIELRGDNALPR